MKGFNGPSELLIRSLAAQKESSNWKFNLYFAYCDGKSKSNLPCGLVVTIKSGDTCTYIIGATDEVGRKCQANTVLLWESILDSKRLMCQWFDIECQKKLLRELQNLRKVKCKNLQTYG